MQAAELNAVAVVLSPHAMATLVVRLARHARTPVEAADRYVGAVRRVVLLAADLAKENLRIEHLESALRLQHVEAAAQLVDQAIDYMAEALHPMTPLRAAASKTDSLADALKQSLTAGGHASARSTAQLCKTKGLPCATMAFDAERPAATAWAEAHAAELATAMTNEARGVVRTVIADALENQLAPRQIAKLVKSVIGLTDRDAGAVMKQQLSDLADGMDVERATSRAERYSDQLLSSRAETIARTEAMTAAHEGQDQLWQQAVADGLLTGNERKVWITADPCEICAPLEGVEADLDEEFELGNPPVHPNCRCTTSLVPEAL